MKTKGSKILAGLIAAILMIAITVPASAQGAPVSGGTVTLFGSYDAPPAVNGNVMISSPSTIQFQYATLVEYGPFDPEPYHMILAESFEQQGNDTVVTLREGLKWSDGSDLTSKDVVCTLNMRYLEDNAVWQDLVSCAARDERTVVFTWRQYSEMLLIRLFNLKIDMSYTNYGEWADQVEPFIAERTYDEVNRQYKDPPAVMARKAQIRQDCYAWLPDLEDAMCSGAYKVDTVSASELLMSKNPYYYNADNVYVENLRMLRFVSTESYLSTIMSGDCDLDVNGLLPDMAAQIEKANPQMRTIWMPELSQQVMEFNINAYPVNLKQVRQAIAFVVDRNILLQVTEAGLLNPDFYNTGVSASWRDKFMTDELAASMTDYQVDYERADELLESLGWSRGGDGYWRDENGELVELEISAMNSWAGPFTCGETASVMLDEYGLKCSFNAMELSAYWDYIQNGEHMIAMDTRGGSPKLGVWEGFSSIYEWADARIGFNEFYEAGLDRETGEIVPLVIEMEDGTSFNVTSALRDLCYGDEDTIKETAQTLMKLGNEQVYMISLSEKYSPLHIYNDKLQGLPEDNMNWLYCVGDIVGMARLLANGGMYLTEG